MLKSVVYVNCCCYFNWPVSLFFLQCTVMCWDIYQNICGLIWVHLIYYDIFSPAERVRYRAYRITYDIWAKILSVLDTSVTYFVLHSLNQLTDETKQCMPVQMNTGAKFWPKISFDMLFNFLSCHQIKAALVPDIWNTAPKTTVARLT